MSIAFYNVLSSGPCKDINKSESCVGVAVMALIMQGTLYSFTGITNSLPLDLTSFAIAAGLSVISILGYVLLLSSLKIQDPKTVAVTRCWEIMFGYVIDWFSGKSVFEWVSFCGILLILFSAAAFVKGKEFLQWVFKKLKINITLPEVF